MNTRPDTDPSLQPPLRNVAIVAHVDHGKTTLVDAMLRQAGALREAPASANDAADAGDRVMDSMDLEREKGITILAKNTAVQWGEVKVNIIDTPGHADFSGEVERGLAMVDGVLLLVDASEGPLPQTRFVLRKSLERELPVVLVINKVDRPDARLKEVIDEVYELFLSLGADDHHIEFPIVYANAKRGSATCDSAVAERARDEPELDGRGLQPLFDTLLATIPPPHVDLDAPLQALVTNLDASPYLGRLALCRVVAGTIRRGSTVAWCRRDGTIEPVKITELYLTAGLEREAVDQAPAGEIIAVAGIADVTIGETLADLNEPVALPALRVDEPNLAMTIGINTSPLAGKEGKKLTARLVKNRLDVETVGNVSIRVLPTERPDAWEVRGRGELALAVLVELMRREGFELTVGKPQVVTHEIDGVRHEPFERLTVDVPEEHVGVVTQLLAARKGQMLEVLHYGATDPWARLDYVVPARGLVGLRSALLSDTRGTAIASNVFEGFQPWCGPIRTRETGSLVADRRGVATTHALLSLQDRGTLFVGPGAELYEGMIIGENVRAEDMDVNASKERKLTNVRSSTAEELVRLTPARVLPLEAALEFVREDECVEVTPDSVRLRKVELDQTGRARAAKRAKFGG